jgi:hypothetical protein
MIRKTESRTYPRDSAPFSGRACPVAINAALAVDPLWAPTHVTLGWIQFCMGNLAAADPRYKSFLNKMNLAE